MADPLPSDAFEAWWQTIRCREFSDYEGPRAFAKTVYSAAERATAQRCREIADDMEHWIDKPTGKRIAREFGLVP